MPLEIMEQVTFNQTFYYWNWNGPIREPAALKFAEVCSQFNAKVKMDSVPDKLMHTPYYI
jgi:aubergine-like protein